MQKIAQQKDILQIHVRYPTVAVHSFSQVMSQKIIRSLPPHKTYSK